MPTVEPTTHAPLEVNEIFITPNIEKLMQNYDALYDLPNAQTDEAKLSLENASHFLLTTLVQGFKLHEY